MLYSIDPLIGFLGMIAAGTLAYFSFRLLDRHSSRRGQ
jgi:hypothetical protein